MILSAKSSINQIRSPLLDDAPLGAGLASKKLISTPDLGLACIVPKADMSNPPWKLAPLVVAKVAGLLLLNRSRGLFWGFCCGSGGRVTFRFIWARGGPWGGVLVWNMRYMEVPKSQALPWNGCGGGVCWGGLKSWGGVKLLLVWNISCMVLKSLILGVWFSMEGGLEGGCAAKSWSMGLYAPSTAVFLEKAFTGSCFWGAFREKSREFRSKPLLPAPLVVAKALEFTCPIPYSPNPVPKLPNPDPCCAKSKAGGLLVGGLAYTSLGLGQSAKKSSSFALLLLLETESELNISCMLLNYCELPPCEIVEEGSLETSQKISGCCFCSGRVAAVRLNSLAVLAATAVSSQSSSRLLFFTGLFFSALAGSLYPKQLGKDPPAKAFQPSPLPPLVSFFFFMPPCPPKAPILSEIFFPCGFLSWLMSTLMSFTSSSYFLNSVLVFCWVQRCEKTLLLMRSQKDYPCWMMLRAKPSRLNGYWKATSAGSSFSRRILRSTVILILPERKEKSRTIVWALSRSAISQQQRFLLPLTCLPTSSTSKRRAWICYIQID